MHVPDTLHEAFAARARVHPDRIAVWDHTQQLTYGELDARSTRVAHVLRSRGADVESRIGLCTDRGVSMIIGMLGILKSGAAYVPIDPDYPRPRIQHIVEDSGMAAALAEPRTMRCLGSCRVPVLGVADGADSGPIEPPPTTIACRNSLAYVIYTSGSTGLPKGALVDHGNVLRLFERTLPLFDVDESDVWSQFHSISFDFSVWEIWGALLSGGRVVVIPSRIARAPREFHTWTEQQQVTILSQTPTAFRQFSQAAPRTARGRAALRVVVFGGEALSTRMLEPWIASHGDERPMLINMYGITETTVHVTHKRLTARNLADGDSLIGVPIDDLQVHLLDDQLQPVSIGTPGRLCVSGPGVARGYLNQPALTAQRFFAYTGADGRAVRCYDSGDVALRRDSGELVYVGRADDQLKVRGYRIEPREVECCLARHSAVAAAVVVPESFGQDATGLVAYLVLVDSAPSRAEQSQIAEALARTAQSELPVYMQPSDYRFVSSFPLTPHGKVDRKSLMAGSPAQSA